MKKSQFEKKKNELLSSNVDYDIQEKVESLKEDEETSQEEEPVGHSYGQAAGLKDDLDEDIGEWMRSWYEKV